MVIAISDLNFTSEAPTVERFPVDGAADTILSGDLVGIYKTGNAKEGQVLKYDDTVVDLLPHGIATSDAAADAEDSTIYCMVEYSGLGCKRATVTGSGSSAVGDPFYATNADIDGTTPAFTMTQPTAGVLPFGYLKEQTAAGETTWKIVLRRSAYQEGLQGRGFQPGPLEAYTADGAITLPVHDHTFVQLTGASSAAMTLAVPTAAVLGFHLYISNSAGTGTHDVDFADEEGTALTRVLLDGATAHLYAHNVLGWRVLG